MNFSSTRHALEALAFREIDLFFSDAITARYLASQSNLSNLSIRPVADTFEVVGILVRRDAKDGGLDRDPQQDADGAAGERGRGDPPSLERGSRSPERRATALHLART